MARKLNERTAADAADKAASAAPAPADKKAKKAAATASAKVVENITDETMIAAAMECGGLKSEVETANGKYRAALKKWEERGVDSADIAWFLRTKRREVHDIEAEIKRRNRWLRVMQIPVGAQLGLFEDGQSVGAKVDGDKIAAERAAVIKANPTEEDLADAHAKGRDAGFRGYGVDVNPFQSADGSPQYLHWLAGRKEGTIEAARKAFASAPEKSAEDLAGEAAADMAKLRDAVNAEVSGNA
jgi:ribosome modulation factor